MDALDLALANHGPDALFFDLAPAEFHNVVEAAVLRAGSQVTAAMRKLAQQRDTISLSEVNVVFAKPSPQVGDVFAFDNGAGPRVGKVTDPRGKWVILQLVDPKPGELAVVPVLAAKLQPVAIAA